MKTIYKYKVGMSPFELSMPVGAIILSVQTQFEEPQMWALVDTLVGMEVREFMIFGTGHPINEALLKTLQYVTTFQMMDGQLVWHLFEKVKQAEGG